MYGRNWIVVLALLASAGCKKETQQALAGAVGGGLKQRDAAPQVAVKGRVPKDVAAKMEQAVEKGPRVAPARKGKAATAAGKVGNAPLRRARGPRVVAMPRDAAHQGKASAKKGKHPAKPAAKGTRYTSRKSKSKKKPVPIEVPIRIDGTFEITMPAGDYVLAFVDDYDLWYGALSFPVAKGGPSSIFLPFSHAPVTYADVLQVNLGNINVDVTNWTFAPEFNPYELIDTDGDGHNDFIDPDDDGDGDLDIEDLDSDGDGFDDAEFDFDADDDGQLDMFDDDDDGDGIADEQDDDSDGDGMDDGEMDADGDGLLDDEEVQEIADSDGDGTDDAHDLDDDNDGTPDEQDKDDDNDGIDDSAEVAANDVDGDGTPDEQDKDDDNDGVPDTQDNDDNNDGIDDRVEEAARNDDPEPGHDTANDPAPSQEDHAPAQKHDDPEPQHEPAAHEVPEPAHEPAHEPAREEAAQPEDPAENEPR